MKVFFSTLLVGFLTLQMTFAQEASTKLWTGVSYRLDLSKKLSLELGQQFRLKDDLKEVDSYITEAEASYSTQSDWEVSAQFRYYSKNDTKGNVQGFENLLRYRIGVTKAFDFVGGDFNFRVAYQNRFSIDRSNRVKQVVRVRPAYTLKIKDWSYDPKFYFEYLKEVAGDKQSDYRYGVGSKIDINAFSSLNFRYFYQKSVFQDNGDAFHHVLSLKYNFG